MAPTSRVELTDDERIAIAVSLEMLGEDEMRRAELMRTAAGRETIELRGLYARALSYLLSFDPTKRKNARVLVARIRQAREATDGKGASHAR